MIYDRVARLSVYRSLGPLFSRAIDYATQTDLLSLPLGRRDIAGDDLYIAAHAYQTKPAALARFEAHRRYVDLQIILRGVEQMDVCDLEGLGVQEAYDAATDNAFFHRPARVQSLTVEAGAFAIFFPHDVHAPTIAVGEPGEVRKVVLKICAG